MLFISFLYLFSFVCSWHDFKGFYYGFKAQATNGVISFYTIMNDCEKPNQIRTNKKKKIASFFGSSIIITYMEWVLIEIENLFVAYDFYESFWKRQASLIYKVMVGMLDNGFSSKSQTNRE